MHDKSFVQARVALRMWRDYFHKEATQGHVIKTLCTMGRRAQAAELFRDALIDFVALTSYICSLFYPKRLIRATVSSKARHGIY